MDQKSASDLMMKPRVSLCTFAISPQLLPASRIALRRCSSTGVQGVFVLLFFGAAVGEIVSTKGSFNSPKPPGSPSPVDDIDDNPPILDMAGAFLFLEAGDVDSSCGANNISSGWGLKDI